MAKSAKQYLELAQKLKNMRVEDELRWYINEKAYSGDHFIFYHRDSKTLVKYPVRPLFNPLPELATHVDNLVNVLASLDLTPFVVPPDLKEATHEELEVAYYQSLLLQSYFKEYNHKIRKMVRNGLVYPVSFIGIKKVKKVFFDGSLVDDVAIEVYDPFDILFDPRYDFESQRVIIKVLRKSKDEILSSPFYKGVTESDLTEDYRDYKTVLEKEKFTRIKSYILYEAEIKEMVNGKPALRILTFTPKGKVLRNDLYEGIDFFTIVPFHPYNYNYYYHPSFLEKLIPLQREIDLILLRFGDFFLRYTKGGFLAQEDTDITFSDESGLIVKYSGLEPPSPLPTPQLPSGAFTYLATLISLIERYGISSLALGKPPTSSNIRSEQMISRLLSQEMRNQKTLVDEYVSTLSKLAKIILFYLSRLYLEPRPIALTTKEGRKEKVRFVSQDLYEKFYRTSEEKIPKIIPIPERVVGLEINIDTDFGLTLDEKRSTIIQLAQYGLIRNIKTILKYFAVGDTADIVLSELQEGTLLQNPEFQALIKQAQEGTLPPEIVDSLARLTRYLAEQHTLRSGGQTEKNQ